MTVVRAPSLAAVALCFLGTLIGAAALAAPPTYEFNLPQQAMADALRAIGRQTTTNILFEPESVENLTAPAVRGLLSAEEAVKRVLAGTKLVVEQTAANSILIALPAPGLLAPAPKRLAQSRGTQDAENPRPHSSADRESSSPRKDSIEEVTVTGSHIRGVVPSSSPLTVYTREDIVRSGAATVDQFVRTIPQNFSSVDASTSLRSNSASGIDQTGGNTYGGAGVNLRGLGPGSTLTLINGHRIAPAGAAGEFTDVSMIPLSAVERVEIMTDGASALYGSDAVAGVVNFILRKDYEGAETSVRYGGATRGGARQFVGSQLLGTAWSSGNIVLDYEHNHDSGLLSTQRDFAPDPVARDTLVPEQTRDNVLVAGSQRLSSSTTLSGDATYGERDFVSDTGFAQRHTVGESKQYGATLEIEQALAGDWRADLTGSYSKMKQVSAARSPLFSDPTLQRLFTQGNDLELRSLELRGDGRVFDLPAGAVRLALGGSSRREELSTTQLTVDDGVAGPPFSENLSRRVTSAYAELFIPLIAAAASPTGANRLEMSLAGRYDRYDDFGSSTNPKVGIVWRPIRDLGLRATYGESFRPPLLTDLRSAASQIVFDLPDASAADGATSTLILTDIGNPNARPETSESYTVGLDFRPAALPGFLLSATYFRVDFRHRITLPPLGSLFGLYAEEATLGSLIDRSPDLAEVEALYAAGTVTDLGGPDFSGVGPAGVEAIFDFRPANIAATRESGFEISMSYQRALSRGNLQVWLGGNILDTMDYQVISTAPDISLVNRLGEPVGVRLRGGGTWSTRALDLSLILNYSESYENDLFIPSQPIDSWTTADLIVRYAFLAGAPQLLRDASVQLSLLNVTDEDPPPVAVPSTGEFFDAGFDTANASPLGRTISIALVKRW